MKKSFIYTLLVISILSACKGDDDIEKPNQAPAVPVLVLPLNNSLCVSSEVEFKWDASTDPENNTVIYKLEVSQSNTFETLDFDKTTIALRELKLLETGKTYYWRVKAIDNKNAASEYSPVFMFIVEKPAVSNHLPFAPELVSPKNNDVINGTSTVLSWTATDFDNDTLTFDVFLDTQNPPLTKVSSNQSATSYNATTLSAATRYYFKIVVKDINSGETIGQVWNFQTK